VFEQVDSDSTVDRAEDFCSNSIWVTFTRQERSQAILTVSSGGRLRRISATGAYCCRGATNFGAKTKYRAARDLSAALWPPRKEQMNSLKKISYVQLGIRWMDW
jgi:hypothetical protein